MKIAEMACSVRCRVRSSTAPHALQSAQQDGLPAGRCTLSPRFEGVPLERPRYLEGRPATQAPAPPARRGGRAPSPTRTMPDVTSRHQFPGGIATAHQSVTAQGAAVFRGQLEGRCGRGREMVQCRTNLSDGIAGPYERGQRV